MLLTTYGYNFTDYASYADVIGLGPIYTQESFEYTAQLLFQSSLWHPPCARAETDIRNIRISV